MKIEEEIKKLRCIHLANRNKNNLCRAIKRAEQLETEKQNLIEKLEEEAKLYEKCRKLHEPYSPSEERLNTKYHYAKDILSYMKGEEK